MTTAIKAVSFDLWDTVFIDESDEPKRAEKGLGTKVEARQALLLDVFGRHKALDPTQVIAAYKEDEEAFRKIWHDEYKTLAVKSRIQSISRRLGLSPPEADILEVSKGWEEMEYQIPPDLAPGVGEVLDTLAGKYTLAVISDAIVSPGRVLRMILDHYGLLGYFKVFTFSDEIGASKPDPLVFNDTVKQLGINAGEVVHIGDRGHNDIQGPHKVGMKAILYDAVKQRPLEGHTPDAVCSDYSQLPHIINQLV